MMRPLSAYCVDIGKVCNGAIIYVHHAPQIIPITIVPITDIGIGIMHTVDTASMTRIININIPIGIVMMVIVLHIIHVGIRTRNILLLWLQWYPTYIDLYNYHFEKEMNNYVHYSVMMSYTDCVNYSMHLGG